MAVQLEVRKRILATVSSGSPLFSYFPRPALILPMGIENEFGVGQKDGEADINSAKLWRVWRNGARSYRDCDHVEFCTGECEGALRVAVASEASKVICWESGFSPWLDNHSRDGKGHTFGGVHENYARRAPRSRWPLMVPYLVARVLFDGAGCVDDNRRYQLSQRADYMVAATGGDTPTRRVIITDRAESLMTVSGWDRFHIICGDPHMSPMNIFLTAGMTGMVGELMDMGVLPRVDYNIDCAVADMRALSISVRDWDPVAARSEWFLKGIKNGPKGALELLERYLGVAETHFAGRDVVTDAILVLVGDTLQKLGKDPWGLWGRLDWVAKLNLLNRFHGAHANDEWIRSQDFEYHLIGAREPDGTTRRGLYAFLVEQGCMEQLFSHGLLKEAILEPSPHTRAFFRGRVAQMVEEEFCEYWHLNGLGECWRMLQFIPKRDNSSGFTVYTGDPFQTYQEYLPRVRAILRGDVAMQDIRM